MATFSGTSGAVKIGANAVAEMDNWSLDADVNLIETTAFGDSWKTQAAGVRSWSGKFNGRWDMTDTNGQAALQALLTGTPATFTLELDVDNTHHYTGSAWLKTQSVKDSETGLAEVEFSFEGDGALTAV